MNHPLQPLPSGIYAVDARFLTTEDGQEVTVHFRGVNYSATVGVNAFGMFDRMSEMADQTPTAPFCGRTFATPVAIVPAGIHKCPSNRTYLPIKLHRAITILGEAMVISPNAQDDISNVNPQRSMEESVLLGSLYWGTLSLVEGAHGTLVLEALLWTATGSTIAAPPEPIWALRSKTASSAAPTTAT